MAMAVPRMARASAAAVIAGTAVMAADEARERQRLRHALRRDDMDNEEAAEQRERNRLRRGLRRSDMEDEEAAEQRERDRLRHGLRRDDMEDEEAAEQRERDRVRRALHREDMDEPEAAEARLRRGDPVTADTLPRRFMEQPTCVCSSCRRRYYCSAGSGTRPQQVNCRHRLLTVCSMHAWLHFGGHA